MTEHNTVAVSHTNNNTAPSVFLLLKRFFKRRTARPCACWLYGELNCWESTTRQAFVYASLTVWCCLSLHEYLSLSLSVGMLFLLRACWDSSSASYRHFTKACFSFALRCCWCLVASVIAGVWLWWLHRLSVRIYTYSYAHSSAQQQQQKFVLFQHPVVNKGLKSPKNLYVPANVPVIQNTGLVCATKALVPTNSWLRNIFIGPSGNSRYGYSNSIIAP